MRVKISIYTRSKAYHSVEIAFKMCAQLSGNQLESFHSLNKNTFIVRVALGLKLFFLLENCLFNVTCLFY